MTQEEKLIRKVSGIGNGAHIFAPKEWIDEEVMILRIPKKNPKEEMIKLLSPYLDKVIAVFLYGSYARGEQDESSDLDIFVIASEKFAVKSSRAEVMVIPESRLEALKKSDPVLFYSMIREAKPLINSFYLENLKNQEINPNYFKEFIKDTRKSISSTIQIMEMDYKLKNKHASESVVYSLILRLRGVFIINLLLSGKIYSKKCFADWLARNSEIDFQKVYSIYRAVRDDNHAEEKVSIEQAESLLNLLKSENKNLEKKLK